MPAPGEVIENNKNLDSGAILARNIGGISANVTVSEEHNDELEITSHPVETGAQISDHSYKRPSSVVVRVGWSNSSEQAAGDSDYVKTTYKKLLDLQNGRQPITVVTGKRTYKNMLIRSLAMSTDQTTENALMVTARCEEVILVSTSTTTVPANDKQKSPQSTGGEQTRGAIQPTPGSPNTGPNSGGLAKALLA